MKTASDGCVRKKAPLAVVEPPIFGDDRALQIDIGGGGQRNAMLLPIGLVLGWIKLDLHELM